MFRALLILTCLAICAGTLSATAQLDNRRFCEQTLSLLADSLVEKLELSSTDTIWTRLSESPVFLQQQLVEKLHEQGTRLYLGQEPASGALNLEAETTALSLHYEAYGQSFFRKGRIRRTCEVSGQCILLDADGQLLRTALVGSLILADSLSFNQAAAARTGQGAYAPEMPGSLFQRVVEPSLIVGITGTLVYLFFASR